MFVVNARDPATKRRVPQRLDPNDTFQIDAYRPLKVVHNRWFIVSAEGHGILGDLLAEEEADHYTKPFVLDLESSYEGSVAQTANGNFIGVIEACEPPVFVFQREDGYTFCNIQDGLLVVAAPPGLFVGNPTFRMDYALIGPHIVGSSINNYQGQKRHVYNALTGQCERSLRIPDGAKAFRAVNFIWAEPGVECPGVASVRRNELLVPLEPLDVNDDVPFVAAYVLSETFY